MALIRIKKGKCLTPKCTFHRYFPMLDLAFDRGTVERCYPDGVEVDFGDTLVWFLHPQITYVLDTELNLEVHMSIEHGETVIDYRSAGCPSRVLPDAVLNEFEMMLDMI